MSDDQLITWLLEAKTPTIRYLTLRDLLNRPADDPDLQTEREEIMLSGPVPDILAVLQPGGYWHNAHNFYSPKYRASHWSMYLLAELHADPAHPLIEDAAGFMLEITHSNVRSAIKVARINLSCFWGTVLWYSSFFGLGDHPHIESIIGKLLACLDVHWYCQYGGDLTCAWGAAYALRGLGQLPPERHTPEIKHALETGIEVLLHEMDYALGNSQTPTRLSDTWNRLNFPLFYHVDLLHALRILALHDALSDPRAQAALEWIKLRRRPDGSWRGSSPFQARTYGLGGKKEIDRWVSLHAARVLKQAGMPV